MNTNFIETNITGKVKDIQEFTFENNNGTRSGFNIHIETGSGNFLNVYDITIWPEHFELDFTDPETREKMIGKIVSIDCNIKPIWKTNLDTQNSYCLTTLTAKKLMFGRLFDKVKTQGNYGSYNN